MPRHFNFIGAAPDVDHTSLISFRVDLWETPTYTLLQQLFYDLYAQTLIDPQYLFMAEQDVVTLTSEIRESEELTRHLFYCVVAGKDDGISLYSRVLQRFPNRTTGSPVNIAPLRDLERGSVILGFFR